MPSWELPRVDWKWNINFQELYKPVIGFPISCFQCFIKIMNFLLTVAEQDFWTYINWQFSGACDFKILRKTPGKTSETPLHVEVLNFQNREDMHIHMNRFVLEPLLDEEISITYSYWDGSGHRRTVKVRTVIRITGQGNFIYVLHIGRPIRNTFYRRLHLL